MKNNTMPTEGENSAQTKGLAGLPVTSCSASSLRIIAEQDSKEFVAFPSPGMDRFTFTREGAMKFANILTAWANGKFATTLKGKGQFVLFPTRDSARTTPPSSLPVDPLSVRVQDSMPPNLGKTRGTDGHDTPQSAAQSLPLSGHDYHRLQTGIVCCDIPSGSCDEGVSSIILPNADVEASVPTRISDTLKPQ